MAVPGGLSLEDAVKLVAAQGKSVSVPMAAAPTIAPERLPGPLQCSLFPFCYPQYCELSSGSAAAAVMVVSSALRAFGRHQEGRLRLAHGGRDLGQVIAPLDECLQVPDCGPNRVRRC